jgi:hypothetical protein
LKADKSECFAESEIIRKTAMRVGIIRTEICNERITAAVILIMTEGRLAAEKKLEDNDTKEKKRKGTMHHEHYHDCHNYRSSNVLVVPLSLFIFFSCIIYWKEKVSTEEDLTSPSGGEKNHRYRHHQIVKSS